MTGREVCVVIGCRNSSAKHVGGGYICSRHWKGVPKALKRRRSLVARRLAKRGEIEITKDLYRCKTERAYRLLHAMWKQMERKAIEAAFGI